MVDRVVEDVQGRLAIDTDVDWGSGLLSHHLLLKLSKEAGLCGSSRELHVLAFARAETGIGDQFGLPTDGSTCGEKNVGSSAATSVMTGEKTGITVAPQLSRFAPLVNQPLPTCALQVPKDMLHPLLVRLPTVRVEAAETADSGCDVWAGAHS